MAMEETPGGEARMTVAAIVATFKDAERDLWDLDMKIESELNRLYAKKTTSGLSSSRAVRTHKTIFETGCYHPGAGSRRLENYASP